MKRIAFVVPWVGRLPVYFPLWLNTCSYNSTVDFIVVTSEKQLGDLPENVRWINMSFKEIQNRFQALFDFPIALQKPYKLCDFKPVYGQAFAPELKGYDFWGYCDVDLLWGDISSFITDELLEQYDRLYTRGHCCIYRNCERVNAWYRELPHEGLQNWESVFSSPKSFCFDECIRADCLKSSRRINALIMIAWIWRTWIFPKDSFRLIESLIFKRAMLISNMRKENFGCLFRMEKGRRFCIAIFKRERLKSIRHTIRNISTSAPQEW